jgi:hypothetical protein
MTWTEIRAAYPDQWLIIEALEARTTPERQRLLEHIAVIERCSGGSSALERYAQLHRQHPQREFYYVHTSRPELDIHEVQWMGIRRGYAA